MSESVVHRSAVLSDDGRYRYRLVRSWRFGCSIAWIMLNPSTADAEVDDATIRKVVGFSKRWGYGRLVVGNLFALRSRDPKVLAATPADERVGPDNNGHLVAMMSSCDVTVFAWGAWGSRHWAMDRVEEVYGLVPAGTELLQVGESLQSGHPRHPLMPAYKTPFRTHVRIGVSNV